MSRTVNFFDNAESGTTPTIGNIVASGLVAYADDATFEASELGSPVAGNIYLNTTDDVIRYYNGTAWVSIVDESSSQTLTNKIIDADNNTVSNIGDEELKAGIDAEKIADGSVTNTEFQYINGLTSDAQTQLDSKIPDSEKGAANGVAELDANTRLPAGQLPLGAMEYKGDWDASTNTPTLDDTDVDKDGDLYRVSVAGTQNLGGVGGGSSEISQLSDGSNAGLSPSTPGSEYLAQTFTTVGAFSLSNVKFKLNDASAALTGSFSVEVWGVSASDPDDSNKIATSDPKAFSSLSSVNTVETFNFSTLVPLSAGTEYAIVLNATTLGGTGTIFVRRESSDVYAGGYATASADGASWSALGGGAHDLYFDIESGSATNTLTVDVGDFVYNDGTKYYQTNSISGKEDISNKGIANGYCPLDGSALVPAINLPSYVDDVLEYADLASFPVTGETGKIYIAIDTNYSYRWTGSVYIDITSKVDSVNSQVGAVVLDSDDITEGSINKYATQAQLDKVDNLTVTQPVDLDTMETDVATNNAKVTGDGSIDTHSDVDVTTTAPVSGDILEFDGVNWVPVENLGGSGSGEGVVNYVPNPDAEIDLGGWRDYNDGTTAIPIDGQGVGSSGNELLDTGGVAGVLTGVSDPEDWFGQSFTTASAGDVDEVTVEFYYDGGTPSGYSVCEIYEDDGTGKPDMGALIGTSDQLPAGSVGTTLGSNNTYVFSTIVPVSAAVLYHAVVNNTNLVYGGMILRYAYDSGSVYAGGGRVRTSNGGLNWTTSGTIDMLATMNVLIGAVPASIVLSRETGTSDLLSGLATFQSTKDGFNRQGNGHSIDCLIDYRYRNSVLTVNIDWKNDVNYVNSAYQVWVYDMDNATMLGPVSNDDDGYLLSHTGDGATFTGQFQTTDSLNYRFIIHNTSTDATAWTLNFDTVQMTPQKTLPSAIVTEWESYTPTGNFTTNITYSGVWRRVGDSAEYDLKATYSGATDAGSFDIDLPSGHVIDTSKISNTSGNYALGIAQVKNGSGSRNARVELSGTTSVKVRYLNNFSGTQLYSAYGSTTPTAIGSGDFVSLKFTAPILGWKASNLVSTTETLFSVPKSFANNVTPTGTLTGSDQTAIFGTLEQNDFGLYDMESLTFQRHFGTLILRGPVRLVEQKLRI